MKQIKSKGGQWSIKSNKEIHALKLEDEGALWLDNKELLELREFLNSLEISNDGDESIVKFILNQ